MVRVIDKEIQQEKVVDDVLSILGDESNVKFIKVCRTDCSGDSQRDSDRVSYLEFFSDIQIINYTLNNPRLHLPISDWL